MRFYKVVDNKVMHLVRGPRIGCSDAQAVLFEGQRQIFAKVIAFNLSADLTTTK